MPESQASLQELANKLDQEYINFGNYARNKAGIPPIITTAKHVYYAWPHIRRDDESQLDLVVITFDDPFNYETAQLYALNSVTRFIDNGALRLQSLQPQTKGKAVLDYLEMFGEFEGEPFRVYAIIR